MTTGGKHVAIVIKNQMAAPVTIDKGIKMAWVVAVNRVTLEKLCLEHWRSWIKCREFDRSR